MDDLEFHPDTWHGTSDQDAVNATLAALRIEAGVEGSPRIPITRVLNPATHSVRDHIYVSAYAVARWLLLNWWRLRWEPLRTTTHWRMTHSLAAIGGGDAWPPLQFSSDGRFV